MIKKLLTGVSIISMLSLGLVYLGSSPSNQGGVAFAREPEARGREAEGETEIRGRETELRGREAEGEMEVRGREAENEPEFIFAQAMRKLFADQAIWTRQYIVAVLASSPDSEEALRRLLKSQEEIGASFVPYYGLVAGNQFTSLLKDQVVVIQSLVSAAKEGSSIKFDEATRQGQVNLEVIAMFLNNVNSQNWSKQDLGRMLGAYMLFTNQEIKARAALNWSGDIAAFDRAFSQGLEIADELSDGIENQFPEKF